MEFYNNKENEPLKFKLNVEGIDKDNIETRLILKTNENKNYLFFGKIEEDLCIFDLPELDLYEKGNSGNVKFEIISEDIYFPVWEDSFDIATKASITFEQLVTETKEKPSKPSITVDPIIQQKVEEKPVIKENKKEEKKKPIKYKKEVIKEKSDIKNFDSFFK